MIKKWTHVIVASLLFVGHAFSADFPKTPSTEGAKVYIVSPKDGDIVSGKITVVFGLRGMGVAPAGVDIPNTGHHHLLIDMETLPDMNVPMPASDQLKHFGKGQTEAEITLPPGEHTLQLVLGDKVHIPHEPPLISEKITVTVK